MKKVLVPIAGVVVFITLIGLLQNRFAGSFYNPLQQETKTPTPTPELKKITVAGNPLEVEIADSDEERRKGLSKRDFLGEGFGMLFVFRENERPTFWMKDMSFAIDIIWIDDGKVVGIDENAQPEKGVPEDDLALYPAPQRVDHVLEVNAGYSRENSLNIGDSVDLTGIN